MNIKNKETEESKMKIKKVLSLLMCILILFECYAVKGEMCITQIQHSRAAHL